MLSKNKKPTSESKKAQSAMILIILTMFGIILLVVVGFFYFSIKPVYDQVTTTVITQFQLSNSSAKILTDTNSKYPTWLDNGFLWLFGGIWFSTLIMAYYSNDNPFLIIVLVIVWIVLIFAAAEVANTWMTFSQTAQYNAYRLQFPFTDWTLSHLPLVLALVGFSDMVVYFMRGTIGAYI